ncbi:MAG: hypothetical protein NTV49_15135 [Kiritimatiellaeota bacterium]|nr:hypothetical protein [Kiritimatiellota bacterium]
MKQRRPSPPRQPSHARLEFGLGAASLLLLLLAPGCRAPRPAAPDRSASAGSPAPGPELARFFPGEVELVNASQRYVVVRAKGLRSASDQAIVLRGSNEVARLLITGPARPPRWTADVLSGDPRVGDRVRLIGTKSTGLQDGEKP